MLEGMLDEIVMGQQKQLTHMLTKPNQLTLDQLSFFIPHNGEVEIIRGLMLFFLYNPYSLQEQDRHLSTIVTA